MLARGKQIQPNDDDATFVGKERFESLDQVQKLVFPRVADKPCRGLNTRIARLLHLGEKGQLGSLSLGHNETVFDIVGGKTLKRGFAAVGVDELAKERDRSPVHWKVVGRRGSAHYTVE